MPRRWILALVLALAACDGGGGDSVDFGFSGDLPGADVPLLSDAVVLEPGGFPATDAPGDVTASDAASDPGPSDEGGAPEDAPAADAGPVDLPGQADAPADALPGDVLPPSDASDAGEDPRDAAGGDPCGDTGAPCDPGQACVTNSDGVSFCTALGDCSGKGAIDLEELVALLLRGEGEVHVKVLAMPWAGKPACSPKPCPADQPCCNTCYAPLFIGLETFPIALMGKGDAVGCQGNECDVLDLCHPFDQGSWYWVWGVASVMGGHGQFLVEGYCPVDLGDLLVSP